MGSNMILISGGPGLYNAKDPEHDESWASYVSPPLLLTDTAAEKAKFEIADEVFWFVFKPAFERRWLDDVKHKRSSVKKIQADKFSSYVDKIEKQAAKRKWKLKWFTAKDEFWTLMSNFNDPIKRVIYWGHANAGDLWLFLKHNSSNEPIGPDAKEIISKSEIAAYANQKRPDGKLMRHRYAVDAANEHLLIGCNTDAFGKEWASQIKVWSKAVVGKIDFKSTHTTAGHMPSLVAAAKVNRYKNDGTLDSSATSW